MSLETLSAPIAQPVVKNGRLVDRFNQAVRQPDRFGGVACLPGLLDQLAAEEGQAGAIWIPDANQRLSVEKAFQGFFPEPEIHVLASQYGEQAFRRGWLRLDRALNPSRFGRLLDGVLPWVKSDRAVTINDITAEYGPASITFGDPDPRHPKTLGYATHDTEAPFLVFHLEATEPTADASSVEAATLLAVRTDFNFAFTTRGRGLARKSVSGPLKGEIKRAL